MERKLNRVGTTRDRDLWERMVNSHWDGKWPVLSDEESVKAAKRLYRHAMGKPWKGGVRVTSGNRRTWIRDGYLIVNPDERLWNGSRGLREIIHSISHYAHRRLHPNDAPHSRRQARLEAKLVRYAIKYKFADGGLAPKAKVEAEKPEPKPIDKVQQRYARMVNRRDKWKAELERSKRLLVKVEREVKAYERRHGERLAA